MFDFSLLCHHMRAVKNITFVSVSKLDVSLVFVSPKNIICVQNLAYLLTQNMYKHSLYFNCLKPCACFFCEYIKSIVVSNILL